MQTILLVGADETLLHTRAAVLGKTGAEVLCANAASAIAVQEDRLCELVVLCHSLTVPVCEEIAETIRMRWPETKILLVVAEREWAMANSITAVDAISSSRPERLVAQTLGMLNRHADVRAIEEHRNGTGSAAN